MATAAGTNSNLLDLVHCDLCLERYNDSDRLPKLLPCSHTFCLACVQKYYKTNLKTKLTCPNCREVFTVPRGGVQKLKTNIMAVNLLDQLAQSLEDTEEGTKEASGSPKSDKTNTNKESKSLICRVHPEEKCDFYCNECSDPLCADCMVSLSEGPHKTHKIRKWKDVLTTYNTQRKEALELVMDIKTEGKKRKEELLEELILSRDSLMKEAKSKCYQAHKEADRWYQDITASISQVYDDLHLQILDFSSRVELQEWQQSLERTDLQHIDWNLKESQSFLDHLQLSVSRLKKSTSWSTKWSADVGKITSEFTIDLGRVTESALNLPCVYSFPYVPEQAFDSNEVNKPVSKQQTAPQKRGFKIVSNLHINPPCNGWVGLSTSEAIVAFRNYNDLKKISFGGKPPIKFQIPFGVHVDPNDRKFILDDNSVLIRRSETGPSYLLSPQQELVSIIKEDYGRIIGAHSMHWVAFSSGDSIRIYDFEQKQLVQTLNKPTWITSWSMSSICRHPDGLFTAVVDSQNYRFFIFDQNAHQLFTTGFQLRPRPFHSVSCNRSHVYVVINPDILFVFTWSGQFVTMLEKHQLEIPSESWIINIAVDEDQFSIAVVDDQNLVSSFKTFQCV